MTTTSIAQILLNDGTLIDAIDIDTEGSQLTTTYLELIVTVADDTSFTKEGYISGDSVDGNDGVAQIIEKDGSNLTLRLISGNFVEGNGVDNTQIYNASESTITSISKNVKVHRLTFNIDEVIGTFYETGE